ncbi:FliI/YscN family ATPase [Rhodothermus bifroesti]|uniref:FliI/YscN family ATPase n=1 Tax=Rhodothermus bifroesti TaxID=2823335 RepID=UPI001AEFFCE3|nr:FliI/YscN family ATPase [Rhodothermus bifroesti]
MPELPSPEASFTAHCLRQIRKHPPRPLHFGKVQSVVGLLIEASDLPAAVGELCYIHEGEQPEARRIKAEVVGLRGRTTLLMPLELTRGLRAGCLVEPSTLPLTVRVGQAMLGRVIDASGRPIDGKGPLHLTEEQPVHSDPPPPLTRRMIDTPLLTGIRAIDTFLTLGRGQRIGIFSGSGVGKSTLLGMIARRARADVNVIALIGERGREVQEFIADNLGDEGLRRSIVVAVTGDQAAINRVKGASVAMAQREIGLAVGEPPTTRGYTPSVFALLPRLLERAGPGAQGSITGIFTVLVDADDMNDPIGDAVRGILDGHIVLSRQLAHANHFPAIDVLQSVSRVMPRITTAEHRALVEEARRLLAMYREAEDLIRVGAYEMGTRPELDRAIMAYDMLMAFLRQGVDETSEDPVGDLAALLKSLPPAKPPAKSR